MNKINKNNNITFKDDENDYIVEINIMNTNQIIKELKISYRYVIIFCICLFIIIGYFKNKKIKERKSKRDTKDIGSELIDID